MSGTIGWSSQTECGGAALADLATTRLGREPTRQEGWTKYYNSFTSDTNSFEDHLKLK